MGLGIFQGALFYFQRLLGLQGLGLDLCDAFISLSLVMQHLLLRVPHRFLPDTAQQLPRQGL